MLNYSFRGSFYLYIGRNYLYAECLLRDGHRREVGFRYTTREVASGLVSDRFQRPRAGGAHHPPSVPRWRRSNRQAGHSTPAVRLGGWVQQ